MSSDTPPSIPPRPKSGTTGTSTSGAAASGSARSGGTTTGSTPAARPSTTSASSTTGAASTTGTTSSTGARPSSSSTGRTATGPARTTTTPAVRPSGTSTAAAATSSPTRPATTTPAATTPAPAAPVRPAGTAATTAAPAVERPAAAAPRPQAKQPAASTGPRRVRLTVSRVDPWSVMKLAFLMSVAVGIMLVVATMVVWLTLDGLHVFSTINDLVTEVLADSDIDLMQYIALNRVVSVATLVAVVDVFLITALATIGAFLYNITAALVGGVHVTMTDD